MKQRQQKIRAIGNIYPDNDHLEGPYNVFSHEEGACGTEPINVF